MPHIPYPTLEIVLYCIAAVVILVLGYQIGKFVASFGHKTDIARREQELFTAQKGFKTLYEQELIQLKTDNQSLRAQLDTLTARIDEYRKKAAGFGGLFNSGGRRADAMYALLLENEALEEALNAQNQKLSQERQDSIKEQLRSTSYRRVLMSQLLNDERIKHYVADVIADDKRLPDPKANPNDETRITNQTRNPNDE
jgi:predicted RNase H-like nuclease (RuvC/YqgF family)